MGLKELLSLFGAAIRAKLISWGGERHGKHYRTRGASGGRHPAGTKLVRHWIRTSGRESVYNRKLYAFLTGKQYEGKSA